MKTNNKLPSFIFNSLEETLIIIWPSGKKEQKTTNWRDKWNNPGFDLDPPGTEEEKKGNWVMFGSWKRVQGENTVEIVRLFYKKVEWVRKNKIITYYMQEQPKQTKIQFILNEADLAQKNQENKWVRVGSDYDNNKQQNEQK